MMKLRLLSGIFLFVALFCATINASAQTAVVAGKVGALRGRVVNENTKEVLTGAAVYIPELQRGVITDVDGYYTMPSIKAGDYNVEVAYVGYEHFTESVSIENGKTTTLDIAIGESAMINKVVVTSVMKGQARAVNTQKNALQMVDVVSSDQAGKYPDTNIGDALKRISGVNVQYDQGEARFGQVRGTPADMSSVTVNGDRLPSAEGETRSVQLDLIPTDMIQTIEVNKVVTPDMDGDAIGGSINLVTKNSPTRKIVTATVGTGYSMMSQRAQLNVAATLGNKINDKLGYLLSMSYQNNPIGSDNTEFEWDKDDDGNVYVKEMQVRQYYVQRGRQSYSAAFNYNFNPNHRIDFKGIYNTRSDWENRYKYKAKFKDDGSAKEVALETKGGTEDQKYGRLELQKTMDYALSGDHLFGNKLSMDWNVSYARASEDRPNERYIAYVQEDNLDGLAMTAIDTEHPYAVRTDAVDIAGADSSLDELSESQQKIHETDLKAKINLNYALSTGNFGTNIKVGAKYVAKDKQVDKYTYEYKKALVDKDGFNAEAMKNLAIADRDGFMAGEQYNFGREFVTREFLGDINFNDASMFKSPEDKLSERSENYTADEDVTSAYLRVDQHLGKKVSMMAGVRMENTAYSNSGFQYIDEDEDLKPTETKDKSYTNILPSVMFKWDATKDLKLRASFTSTLARPKYSDLVNNIITDKDEEIKFGNPDLEATISNNFDLSADYYFEAIGLVRAGFFAKQIDGFIVDYRAKDYEYGDYSYDKFKKPINAGDANLYGFEMSLSRDFGFISPALNCIGMSGTYTFTHSEVKNFNVDGREDEVLPLPGSPKNTANASIYFEKWGLTARLSYNYASEFIDEVGGNSFEDRYYDAVNYLDLNLNYGFGKGRYNVYADATNLTNQPLRYYQGVEQQTMQVEYYGTRFNVGFKVNF